MQPPTEKVSEGMDKAFKVHRKEPIVRATIELFSLCKLVLWLAWLSFAINSLINAMDKKTDRLLEAYRVQFERGFLSFEQYTDVIDKKATDNLSYVLICFAGLAFMPFIAYVLNLILRKKAIPDIVFT
jgi:hypothetical protein